METNPLDLHSIRCGVKELEEIYINYNESSNSQSDQLIQDSALHLENKVEQLINDCSDFSFLGIDDMDAFVEHLQVELNATEAETLKISNEIQALTKNHVEDSDKLESDIEMLNCSLDFMSSEDMEIDKEHALKDNMSSVDVSRDFEFEILKLDDQIEKSRSILKSLEDFDSLFKRVDAIEQIEEAFSGLKVIEFDGKCIKLSLRTYLPKLEDLTCQHKFDDLAIPSEINHELLMEVTTGTMELKNAEMFPDDVYIADIVDAAKSFREQFSCSGLIKTRSSLEWFVRTVQDRIIQCTLRRLLVKSANKSRHSFEYLERDESVVAHMVGGVDAFIKLCQGWPISSSPLKLISLRSSDQHSKEISLSFLCRVEEVVNSLDVHMRLNLLSFVEAIEKLLMEEMRKELNSDGASKV